MLGIWDVEDVGYLGCGMFGLLDVWDVQCGMFAGMWDVGLQNTLALVLGSNSFISFSRKGFAASQINDSCQMFSRCT